MAYVKSFKSTQVYTSYMLVLEICISNNFQVCIMSCYTASKNRLYCIYIYNGGKQLFQLLWNMFLHIHYRMFHVLWHGSSNKLWNVTKFYSILFHTEWPTAYSCEDQLRGMPEVATAYFNVLMGPSNHATQVLSEMRLQKFQLPLN